MPVPQAIWAGFGAGMGADIVDDGIDVEGIEPHDFAPHDMEPPLCAQQGLR